MSKNPERLQVTLPSETMAEYRYERLKELWLYLAPILMFEFVLMFVASVTRRHLEEVSASFLFYEKNSNKLEDVKIQTC